MADGWANEGSEKNQKCGTSGITSKVQPTKLVKIAICQNDSTFNSIRPSYVPDFLLSNTQVILRH
jgi:hypothetical protein